MSSKTIPNKIDTRVMRLNRFLNDSWIFATHVRPALSKSAKALRSSKSKTKQTYSVPREGKLVTAGRTDSDLGDIYQSQYERGIFESQIVNIVSRAEAFIQECMVIAIKEFPEKLSIISDKAGIPVQLFLEHEDRDAVLSHFIALKCEGLMFGKPSDYLEKAASVLSVKLTKGTVAAYIEVKASRDIIVHNLGAINHLYIDKAGKKSRGKLGEELVIDQPYFRSVIKTVKILAEEIQLGIAAKYRPKPAVRLRMPIQK